ncbi:MAG: aldolase [Chloroflexi bacterium]|nr:aldolase [Chloroflexota bacterium]
MEIGRDLFLSRLVSSHSGNMSLRQGEKLLITRRGSMLGRLRRDDLVVTGIFKDDEATPLASRELAVHRAIYQHTEAGAVIHAHPPHAIALSLVREEIQPLDREGKILLAAVPVLSPPPDEVPLSVSLALKEHPIVMVKGHGSFAAGSRLQDALLWTSALEASCQVICVARDMGLSHQQL